MVPPIIITTEYYLRIIISVITIVYTYFQIPILRRVPWPLGLLISQFVCTQIVLWLAVADMWLWIPLLLEEYLDIAHTTGTRCRETDQAGTTGNWDCCLTRKNHSDLLLNTKVMQLYDVTTLHRYIALRSWHCLWYIGIIVYNVPNNVNVHT